MTTASVRYLRLIGWVEGVSFLLLLGIAMPLKWIADIPIAVKVMGPIHGGLFIAFCMALAWVMGTRRWSLGRGAMIFLSSLVPAGTFLIDRRIRAWDAEDQPEAATAKP